MGDHRYRDDIRSEGARGLRDQRSNYSSSSSIFSDEDLVRGRSLYGGDGGYGRDEDRGGFARAADEVRSWFGDDEAERRREGDALRRDRGPEMSFRGQNRPLGRSRGQYYGSGDYYGGTGGDWGGEREPWGDGDYYRGADRQQQQGYGGGQQHGSAPTDPHYRSWRDRQIAELDRDYDEYQSEQRQQFGSDFDSWRRNRQMSQGNNTSGGTSPTPDAATSSAETRGRTRTKS